MRMWKFRNSSKYALKIGEKEFFAQKGNRQFLDETTDRRAQRVFANQSEINQEKNGSGSF